MGEPHRQKKMAESIPWDSVSSQPSSRTHGKDTPHKDFEIKKKIQMNMQRRKQEKQTTPFHA
jgi:hypothetical protein